jgi:hypothetical protein
MGQLAWSGLPLITKHNFNVIVTDLLLKMLKIGFRFSRPTISAAARTRRAFFCRQDNMFPFRKSADLRSTNESKLLAYLGFRGRRTGVQRGWRRLSHGSES